MDDGLTGPGCGGRAPIMNVTGDVFGDILAGDVSVLAVFCPETYR